MSRKKPSLKLPEKNILKNDGENIHQESWYEGRSLLDFPSPFKIFCSSPPRSGKSTFVYNVFLRTDHEKYVLIHPNIFNKEYDYLWGENNSNDVSILNKFPDHDAWVDILTDGEFDENDPDFFEKLPKTLCIIDDIQLKNLNRKQQQNLQHLFQHLGSHYRIDIILCTQDWSLALPGIRRLFNVFRIKKGIDVISMNRFWSVVGVESNVVKNIFETNLRDKHDYLLIDLTIEPGRQYRKNGFEILNIND